MRVRASAAPFLALVLVAFVSCATTRQADLARQWYELGNSWLDKGDWKRAGQAYSRALALDPYFSGASYNLARALTESGDYDRALKALDELAKSDPGNVKILASRAYALYKKGDAICTVLGQGPTRGEAAAMVRAGVRQVRECLTRGGRRQQAVRSDR